MQETKKDSEKKQEVKQELILLSKQKLQYSLLRVCLLATLLASVGIAGRTALQAIPSVEPLTPLTILIGFLMGPIAGFFSGIYGFFVSNFFVVGWQGPWTIFQCVGAGLAGMIGGFFGKINKNSRNLFLISNIIGIILYEIIVTLGGWAIFTLALVPVSFYFLTSLPFSVVHLVSSLGFSLTFFEFKNQIKNLMGGKIIDKEIFGFRSSDSSSGKPSDKPIPYLYFRKIFGSDKGKSDDKFWFVRKKQNSDNE